MSKKSPQLRFKGFTDDWEERKLGEVGYFYYGKSAPKWSVTEDAETPCVRYGELYTKYGAKISNIYSHTNINPKNLKFSTGNEVLVPRVGENPLDFSLCSWLSIPNVAIGEMISVYNTNENPLFISYYFRSQMKYEFAKRVEGGNVSNLYYSYLEDIDLYIPKLEEQIAISKFFEKLDDTIALHQRKLDLLKEQKKGYLQKMFPKNGAKVPELRFAGFADDWEERKLKDVVEKQIKGKAQFEKLAQGDVEYLDTSRLNGGQAILTNGLKDVTLDDILILWDGSKAGTVYHGFEGALGSTLKAYRTSANSKFVYQYLKRHQDNIYNNYRTPNIPHVQKDFLNVFTISVPGSDEQAKIGSFFKKLDDTIALHQRKLDLLKEQKKAFYKRCSFRV